MTWPVSSTPSKIPALSYGTFSWHSEREEVPVVQPKSRCQKGLRSAIFQLLPASFSTVSLMLPVERKMSSKDLFTRSS